MADTAAATVSIGRGCNETIFAIEGAISTLSTSCVRKKETPYTLVHIFIKY